MSNRSACWALAGILLAQPLFAGEAATWPVATLADAIGMQRIQYSAAQRAFGGPVAAISPNGEKAAVVIWHGDLQRNVNVYTLTLLDIRLPLSAARKPVPVLSLDFAGDPDDPVASPMSQLTFLDDNRTITYLGRDGDNVAQAFAVDTQTSQVRQLTHHATRVHTFVAGADGRPLAYAATSPIGNDERAQRMAE